MYRNERTMWKKKSFAQWKNLIKLYEIYKPEDKKNEFGQAMAKKRTSFSFKYISLLLYFCFFTFKNFILPHVDRIRSQLMLFVFLLQYSIDIILSKKCKSFLKELLQFSNRNRLLNVSLHDQLLPVDLHFVFFLFYIVH